jgi:uncharacterized RDD family membrane protein YckC
MSDPNASPIPGQEGVPADSASDGSHEPPAAGRPTGDHRVVDGRFHETPAQAFRGVHLPGWIPELGLHAGSVPTRITAKSVDIAIYLAAQTGITVAVIAAFAPRSSRGGAEAVSFSLRASSDLVTLMLLGGALLVVDLLYNVVLTARFGGTPGKLLLGLRVVRTDGRSADFATAFLRWTPVLGLTLLGMIPVIGLLAAVLRVALLVGNLAAVLGDEHHRSIFDRVGGTYVVTR